ncbi:transposable element Tcb2 transposase [Trichonephila clavipes]|nr:transposable element Tcb2 transposase [Trichonephila clavipes]
MQRVCALRKAGRGRLTSSSMEHKAANCFIGRHTGTGSTFTRGPVSSRTIRRLLAEGHLVSRRPLRVLPLTPTYQRLRLEWCRGVAVPRMIKLDCSGMEPETHRSHSWCDGMGPLVLIRGIMIAQQYFHDILQPRVLPFIQRFSGTIFQQDNAHPNTATLSQDYLCTVTTLPWPARTPDLFPIEHIWDHLGRRVGNPTSLSELEERVSPNVVYKLGGEAENIVRSHNYIGNHGRKVIVGTVSELSRSAHMLFPHFRQGLRARNLNCYAKTELADIHFIYGLANGNGRVAVRLYGERYPMRR